MIKFVQRSHFGKYFTKNCSAGQSLGDAYTHEMQVVAKDFVSTAIMNSYDGDERKVSFYNAHQKILTICCHSKMEQHPMTIVIHT